LAAALGALVAAAPDLAPAERAALDMLAGFAARLSASRFQLAAAGQFKRGKSSLLNALLGIPVLPTGVVPLTAIACSIVHAEVLTLSVVLARCEADARTFATTAALSEALATYATETGNPHNAKGVIRIEIGLPAALLADGLVLIDTPGIGSAERHNSAAALAALPDCDAALFVFSPDPPLSEAELDYLRAVQRHAALIIPVLTKADTIAAADRTTLLDYARPILADAGVPAEPSLVSATTGEGIAALGDRLAATGAGERTRLLEAAIRGKATAQLGELAFHNATALAALAMPLDQLDGAAAAIEAAAAQLRRYRTAEADLLAGERKRLAAHQDEEARALAETVTPKLVAVLNAELDKGGTETGAFAAITTALRPLFAEAFGTAAERQRVRLSGVAAAAAGRLAPELETLRRRAAEALGINACVAPPTLDPTPPPTPAWNDRAAERMNPLPPGAFEPLLPVVLRRRRMLRRQSGEVDRLVKFNVERLRWALRQTGEDALRELDARVTDTIASAITATTDIIDRIKARRNDDEARATEEIAARRRWAKRLADFAQNNASLDRPAA
jgi:hypothetical protein